MKTVCKRLLSFVLVALLLVSAVPFQASAATEYGVWVDVYDADGKWLTKYVVDAAEAGYEKAYVDGQIADPTDAKANFDVLKGEDKLTYVSCTKAEIKDDTYLVYYVVAEADEDQTPPAATEFTVKTEVSEGMSLQTITLPDTYTKEEAKELTNAQLVAGSKYAAGYKLTGRSGPTEEGTVLKFTLNAEVEETKEEEEEEGGNTTGDGENQPEVDNTTTENDIKVKINLALGYGWETRNMNSGKTFAANGLVTPERGGYTCLGFYYVDEDDQVLGKVDLKNDYPEDGDRVLCKWSVKKFTITYDLNRADVEPINKVLSVTFGEEIYDRLYAYKPSKEGDVFVGWKINDTIVTKDYVFEYPGDVVAYAVWKLESDTPGQAVGGTTATPTGKVYLEVYKNGNVETLDKRINITDYAGDNKITMDEVKKVIKAHYTPKAGYSLKVIGLFDEDGWWWYTRDPETSGKDAIVVNRDGNDYISVVVNNVKTSVKDPESPATGDSIYMAVTGLGISATALAVLYFFNKKRAVR